MSRVYSVTIPVKLWVTIPDNIPDGEACSHAKSEIQVRAKRFIASILESRSEGCDKELPEGWEVNVETVEKASYFTRFLP